MSSFSRKFITLTLTFKIGQGRIYTYQATAQMLVCQTKAMHDLLFDGNSNVSPIFHHFQDIHCGNVRGLDLDLYNGPRSNVITPMKSPYMTCYLMAIVICTLFVTLSKIFIVEMYMTLTLTFRMYQVNIPVERPYMTSHSLSLVICTISVIVCTIIIYELSEYCRLQHLTLK